MENKNKKQLFLEKAKFLIHFESVIVQHLGKGSENVTYISTQTEKQLILRKQGEPWGQIHLRFMVHYTNTTNETRKIFAIKYGAKCLCYLVRY